MKLGSELWPARGRITMLPPGPVVEGAIVPKSMVDAAERTHVSRRFRRASMARLRGKSYRPLGPHPAVQGREDR